MAIEVNIVNDVVEFVQRDSVISILLALSTFALVIITAVALWRTSVNTRKSNDELRISNAELRKSNELMTLELRQKFAPSFSIDNRQIQYETDKVTANFSCSISNKGKIPLHNLKIYVTNFKELPSLEKLLKEESKIKSSIHNELNIFPPDTNIPNFKYTFSEPDQSHFCIIIWFDFEYLEDIYEEMIYLVDYKKLQTEGYDIISNKIIQKTRTDIKEKSSQ